MQCFGNFNKFDRICQLCIETNPNVSTKCIEEKLLKEKINDEILTCPFKIVHYDKDWCVYYKCAKTNEDCYCYYLKWGE